MDSDGWANFILDAAHEDTLTEIASKSGVSKSTVHRWLNKSTPDPREVISFARAYGKSPLLALVAAEILDETEAIKEPWSPDLLSNDALLDEIERRFNR